jgi:hypothetical protein
MAIWDMLSTTPKDKTRRRSERSVTPLPMPADTDEPTSAAIVASELYPKLEGPHTPTPGLSKRKNENGYVDIGFLLTFYTFHLFSCIVLF